MEQRNIIIIDFKINFKFYEKTNSNDINLTTMPLLKQPDANSFEELLDEKNAGT